MSAHAKPQPKSGAKGEVRTIPAGEFKAKCLQLMDEVLETKRPITVTKRGKVIGQFVPMPEEVKPFRSIFGRTPGSTTGLEAALKKSKAEFRDEWNASTERLKRQLDGDFSE